MHVSAAAMCQGWIRSMKGRAGRSAKSLRPLGPVSRVALIVEWFHATSKKPDQLGPQIKSFPCAQFSRLIGRLKSA